MCYLYKIADGEGLVNTRAMAKSTLDSDTKFPEKRQTLALPSQRPSQNEDPCVRGDESRNARADASRSTGSAASLARATHVHAIYATLAVRSGEDGRCNNSGLASVCVDVRRNRRRGKGDCRGRLGRGERSTVHKDEGHSWRRHADGARIASWVALYGLNGFCSLESAV